MINFFDGDDAATPATDMPAAEPAAEPTAMPGTDMPAAEPTAPEGETPAA